MLPRSLSYRRLRSFACSIAVVAVVMAAAVARSQEKTIEGIGPAGEIEKIDAKFDFTEGPVWIKDSLYFTDIPKERIYRLDEAGKVHVFVEKSKHANGLFAHASGEIYACQMDGRVAVYSADGKQERPLVEKYKEHRFNAPNDLVIDRDGGVYFTDPAFSAPMPLPQGKTCVYYINSGGELTRLAEDLPNPNGVILSPDEQTLYVIPSGQAEMMAYAVKSPGKLGEGKVFCTLKQPAEQRRPGGGDGLTVDVRGNVYITSRLGLQVFDPAGVWLGTIPIPEQPANVTFGGKDLKTLYVTARTGVYKMQMQVAGHRFPAGEK